MRVYIIAWVCETSFGLSIRLQTSRPMKISRVPAPSKSPRFREHKKPAARCALPTCGLVFLRQFQAGLQKGNPPPLLWAQIKFPIIPYFLNPFRLSVTRPA